MKKINILIFIFVLVISLAACSSEDLVLENEVDGNNSDDTTVLLDSVPERKIIYNVTAEFYTTDLEETIIFVENLLMEDEWFDQENIYSSSAFFVFRVKTARLDAFVNQIKDEFTLTSYSKTATDISLSYQDTANEILRYQEERARLIVLYESASLSDMITINTRISQIDIQLGELIGTLNEFDSLVDYSRVELRIRSSHVSSKLSFGVRLINGFVDGFFSLVDFFDGLLVLLVTLIPWAAVMVPSGYGIYVLIRKRNTKLETKRQEKKAKQEIKQK